MVEFMKYEVIKEFQYIKTGIDYNPGEVFETEDQVQGLILRGIIRATRPQPTVVAPCDEECQAEKAYQAKKAAEKTKRSEECKEVCIENRLDNSKIYETKKYEVEIEPIQPKVEAFDPTGLEKYKPAKQLEQAQAKSTTKVLEAATTVAKSKTRSARQIEMSVDMTELVDEVAKAEETAVKAAVKSKRKTKQAK